MSECMTLDLFAGEEKYPDEGLGTTKGIVRSILNEALHLVVCNPEKVSDSNQIGDYSIADGFVPQLGYIPADSSESVPVKINESSEENKSQDEEKSKEYVAIKEQALVDNELRIQNDKIHFQSNGLKTENVTLSEEIRIAETDCLAEVNNTQTLLTEGVDKKIESSSENVLVNESGEGKAESSSRPFAPFTTEDLRQSILQIWKNVNSPVLNGWDDELMKQPEEIVHLMEELSTIQVTANESSDPNRPRICNLLDEDAKKMFTEKENMNFKANSQNDDHINDIEHDPGRKNEEENPVSGELSVKQVKLESQQKDQQPRVEVMSVSCASETPSAPAIELNKFTGNNDLKTSGTMFKTSLTEYDETLTDSSESVIQITEPQEDSNEEAEEGSVAFSLPQELYSEQYNEDEAFQDSGRHSKVQSGMTTVGPIKNLNHDPKLVTWSEIDYGKMTKITGSRELKKNSTNESLNSSTSRKNCDDSEEDQVMLSENGFVEFDGFVNHDIASLTKVQRVNEVLSDQPKSVEDFKEEDKLLRPPLDLKDVDAESFESFNVIDIGLPLFTGNDLNYEKEFCQNIQMILQQNNHRSGPSQSLDDANEKSSQQEKEGSINLKNDMREAEESSSNDKHPQTPFALNCNKSATEVSSSHNQKHNTISRVFQKASSKFMMRDEDSLGRSSKSLPRDSCKARNVESIKSFFEEYQTSAAAMLRKSRTLLKSTQNVLKAVSKTGFGHSASDDKQAYALASDAEVGQSTSSKKNDFLRFKNNIKNRVGKTLRNLENVTSPDEHKSKDCESSKPKIVLASATHTTQNRSDINDCEIVEVTRDERDAKQGQDLDRLDPDATEVIDGATFATAKEIEVLCDVQLQRNRRCPTARTHSSSVPSDLNIEKYDEEHHINLQTKTTDAEAQRPSNHAFFRNSFAVGSTNTLPVDGVLQQELVAIEGGNLHKSFSTGKLRRKNKLSARIRSFWQTAFGKVKAASLKKDVS